MYKLFNENTVFGFKAFEKTSEGLRCRDYIYTPGQLHKIEGTPVVCSHGFHFCENLEDISAFYDLSSDNIVVYPVAAIGDISGGRDKKATNKLIVFNNPIPSDVKKSRFRFNTKDVIELSDGTEISSTLDNEVDKYLFENLKETEVIKKGYVNMPLGDYLRSKETIDTMDYSDSRRLIFYCKETEKDITSCEMIKDFLNGELIVDLYCSEVEETLKEFLPNAVNLIMSNNRIMNNLGYFKSNKGSYYIPELDVRRK